jgi:hypothetical protein
MSTRGVWSTPADLREQVQRLWDKGALLAALARSAAPTDNERLFPMRLTLKAPSATELQDHFEDARSWARQLEAMTHVRIERREFRHRVLGSNTLPATVWIDELPRAVALIGKQKELRTFAAVLEVTRMRQPDLRAWLARRPLQAVVLADVWPQLLDVIAWLRTHPRPGIYLRQIDVPGVHSKFIEAHRTVLSELLDLALPADAIDVAATGVGGFARRYGFIDKPERIRFRILDPACNPIPGATMPDITLDADSFARIQLAVKQVFITENETNFLALPPLANSIAIFGAGYGFEVLGRARWLNRCRLHYWGDIDTHGFAILDALRSRFSTVESLLMDRQTLLACRALWGSEDTPVQRDLPRLNKDEQALYDDLRDNRIQPHLRLEQERIDYPQVLAALKAIAQPLPQISA